MGYFYYGTQSYEIELPDRALAHLKVALLSLLRSGQSVAFTFARPVAVGSGRETLWITPTTNVRFRFQGDQPPRLNEQWVRAIMATAGEPTGLVIVPEPSAEPAEQVGTASGASSVL